MAAWKLISHADNMVQKINHEREVEITFKTITWNNMVLPVGFYPLSPNVNIS